MNQEVITELNKILPVVERVHSDNHPELHEVAKLYAALLAEEKSETFEALRAVTSDFAVPADACPTFEKTYRDLALLYKEHVG